MNLKSSARCDRARRPAADRRGGGPQRPRAPRRSASTRREGLVSAERTEQRAAARSPARAAAPGVHLVRAAGRAHARRRSPTRSARCRPIERRPRREWARLSRALARPPRRADRRARAACATTLTDVHRLRVPVAADLPVVQPGGRGRRARTREPATSSATIRTRCRGRDARSGGRWLSRCRRRKPRRRAG